MIMIEEDHVNFLIQSVVVNQTFYVPPTLEAKVITFYGHSNFRNM